MPAVHAAGEDYRESEDALEGHGSWQITQSLATHSRQTEAGSFMYLAVAVHSAPQRRPYSLDSGGGIGPLQTGH